MSDWAISVPHRDRAEALVDVASNCRHLPNPDDRAVARTIVIDASIDGMRTAGDLLDHLGALEPAQRRQLLDQARVESGLPPTGDVEAVARSVVASRAGAVRAAADSPFQLCHGQTGDGRACNAMPVDALGVPVAVNVVRWHCDAHRDQAAPGDMGPRPAPWKYSASGAIVENDPAEEARAVAAAESRRNQHDARLAECAAEAAANREHQAARDEAHDRELPEHLRRLIA